MQPFAKSREVITPANLQKGRACDEAKGKLAMARVADEHALLERLRPLVRRVHRCAHLHASHLQASATTPYLSIDTLRNLAQGIKMKVKHKQQ